MSRYRHTLLDQANWRGSCALLLEADEEWSCSLALYVPPVGSCTPFCFPSLSLGETWARGSLGGSRRSLCIFNPTGRFKEKKKASLSRLHLPCPCIGARDFGSSQGIEPRLLGRCDGCISGSRRKKKRYRGGRTKEGG